MLCFGAKGQPDSKNKMQKRRKIIYSFAQTAIGMIAIPGLLKAQTAADKPVRIVVPYPPGAGTDAVARLLALKLADLMGQPVVVENRTGAGGAVGARYVMDALPDGKTLLLAAAPFTTVPAAITSAGYDPVGQFAPVGMIASGPLVWAANKDLPAATLRELVALARAQPGALNYGSGGAGGINHLLLEMLKTRTGSFITHIPYRGVAPAILDMMSGQIQLVTGTLPALIPFIKDDRVKALAVSSARRSPALPDVLGMAESGFANFDVLNYFGLMAPKATSVAVLDRLHAALAAAVLLADVRARFALDGLEPASLSRAQWAAFVQKDLQDWRQVVVAQGLNILAD